MSNIKLGNDVYTDIEAVRLQTDTGATVEYISDDIVNAIASGSVVNINLRDGTEIRNYAFQGCKSLESVTGYAKKVGLNAFDSCSSLRSIDFAKKITQISNNAFSGCANIEGEVSFENPISGYTGTNAFMGCNKITKMKFTFADNTNGAYGLGSSFKNCTSLKTVDASNAGTLYTSCFEGCTALRNLILRRTSGICGLYNNTPFLNGTTAVTVYVPTALLSAYQADAKWSANSGIVTFAPIEGSEFE